MRILATGYSVPVIETILNEPKARHLLPDTLKQEYIDSITFWMTLSTEEKEKYVQDTKNLPDPWFPAACFDETFGPASLKQGFLYIYLYLSTRISRSR
jgi:hypothetical protein